MSPPLWYPHDATVMYYWLRENEQTGNNTLSQCAPSPTGDWWRKRGLHFTGIMISTEQLFFIEQHPQCHRSCYGI